jgi:hypothetical protein
VDDIVGVIVQDEKEGERAFLSWGRIHDPVDPEGLLARFRRVLSTMGFSDSLTVRVCGEIAEVRDFAHFYEGLLSFAEKRREKACANA